MIEHAKAEQEHYLPTFSSLSSLTSFVINTPAILSIHSLPTSAAVSVLSDILASGIEITQLSLPNQLPYLLPAIRQCQTLTSLTIGKLEDCKVTSLELIRAVSASLGPGLRRLEIAAVNINPEESEVLCQGLAKCTSLESISMLNNSMGDIAAERLVTTLNALPCVMEVRLCWQWMITPAAKLNWNKLLVLDLSNNELGYSGINAIADGLLAGRKDRSYPLQSLCLLDNRAYLQGLTRLPEILMRTPHLQRLGFTCTCMKLDMILAIVKAIRKSCAKTLVALKLSDCELCGGVVPFIGQLGLCALETLDLGHSMAENEGTRAASKYMLALQKAQEMTEQSSEMDETGAKSLASALGSVLKLNLAYNELGATGAAYICSALISASLKQPLELLDLGQCWIGDEGAKSVGSVISHRGCRRVLLPSNGIHAKGAGALADAIAHSWTTLKMLSLRANLLETDGVLLIAQKVVRPNRRVEELDLSTIIIGEKAALELADAVRTRNREGGVTTEISLSANKCDPKGLKAITEAAAETGMTLNRLVD